MQRNNIKRENSAEEMKARKQTSIKQKKRKPGLQKQPKRKGKKQQVNRAGAGGSTKLVDSKKQSRQRKKRMSQSVKARKRRTTFKPVFNFTDLLSNLFTSSRLVSGILLGLTIYVLILIGTNPRFYMSRIEIEGTTILHRDEVINSSGVVGEHIFSIEPAVVAENVKQTPGVLAAQVDLQWPDKLNIAVVEDKPVLNWRENGRQYWVNTEGAIIPAFGQDMNLLTIESIVPLKRPSVPAFGALTSDDDEDETTVDRGVSTYLEFVPSELIETAQWLKEERPEITQLTYTPADGLQFETSEGWVAKFGVGGSLVKKMSVYEAIAEDLRERGIGAEYINVAHPDKPVFRPISGYTPKVYGE